MCLSFLAYKIKIPSLVTVVQRPKQLEKISAVGPSLCVGGRVSQLMFLLLVVRLSLAPVLSWCQLSQEIPMARRRLERARIFSFPCTSICFPLDLIIILCICYISMILSHKFVPKFFLNMLQCGKYFYQFYFLEDITERTF